MKEYVFKLYNCTEIRIKEVFWLHKKGRKAGEGLTIGKKRFEKIQKRQKARERFTDRLGLWKSTTLPPPPRPPKIKHAIPNQ